MEKDELEQVIEKSAGQVADGFRAGLWWMALWPILIPWFIFIAILLFFEGATRKK